MNCNQIYLRNSIMKHQKKYQCRFCGKKMSDRGNVKRHETACSRYHHYISGNTCLLCNKSYTNPHNLAVHMYMHRKKNDFSGHKYIRVQPKRNEVLETNLKSNLCSESFDSESDLNLHVKNNHFSEELEDTIKSETKLKHSSGKLPGEVTKLYECPLCSSKWLLLREVQDHINEYHHISEETQSKLGIKIEEFFV